MRRRETGPSRCPSTGRRFLLGVPNQVGSCHAAAAWLAGFDDPRAGEIRGLRACDVDLAANVLRVRQAVSDGVVDRERAGTTERARRSTICGGGSSPLDRGVGAHLVRDLAVHADLTTRERCAHAAEMKKHAAIAAPQQDAATRAARRWCPGGDDAGPSTQRPC